MLLMLMHPASAGKMAGRSKRALQLQLRSLQPTLPQRGKQGACYVLFKSSLYALLNLIYSCQFVLSIFYIFFLASPRNATWQVLTGGTRFLSRARHTWGKLPAHDLCSRRRVHAQPVDMQRVAEYNKYTFDMLICSLVIYFAATYPSSSRFRHSCSPSPLLPSCFGEQKNALR